MGAKLGDDRDKLSRSTLKDNLNINFSGGDEGIRTLETLPGLLP